jgi:hypothetical protein
LKWTFEILVFKTSRSASSLGDNAGNGKSEEGKRNEPEPERRILLSSDRLADKKDEQKQELQLNDSANYSKHQVHPSCEFAFGKNPGKNLSMRRSSHVAIRRSSKDGKLMQAVCSALCPRFHPFLLGLPPGIARSTTFSFLAPG